jgi:hypothetical protein
MVRTRLVFTRVVTSSVVRRSLWHSFLSLRTSLGGLVAASVSGDDRSNRACYGPPPGATRRSFVDRFFRFGRLTHATLAAV